MDRRRIELLKNRLQGGLIPQLDHGPMPETRFKRLLYSFNNLVDELCAMNDLHVLTTIYHRSFTIYTNGTTDQSSVSFSARSTAYSLDYIEFIYTCVLWRIEAKCRLPVSRETFPPFLRAFYY
jgi:hypothetical protein